MHQLSVAAKLLVQVGMFRQIEFSCLDTGLARIVSLRQKTELVKESID